MCSTTTQVSEAEPAAALDALDAAKAGHSTNRLNAALDDFHGAAELHVGARLAVMEPLCEACDRHDALTTAFFDKMTAGAVPPVVYADAMEQVQQSHGPLSAALAAYRAHRDGATGEVTT